MYSAELFRLRLEVRVDEFLEGFVVEVCAVELDEADSVAHLSGKLKWIEQLGVA